MVFWSSAAASSEWVEREWRSALEANKKIVPMLLDDNPLPPPLRARRGSERTSDEVDSARSPEFSAIGNRFTRALFNEPPDAKSWRSCGILGKGSTERWGRRSAGLRSVAIRPSRYSTTLLLRVVCSGGAKRGMARHLL